MNTETVTVTDIINAINSGTFTVTELNRIKDAAASEAQDMQVTAEFDFPEFDQDRADFAFSTVTGIPMF